MELTPSYSKFKRVLGIVDEKDAQYVQLLKSISDELASQWGIIWSKDIVTKTQVVNLAYDTDYVLDYTNLIDFSIIGYTEDIDYTIDLVSGTLQILSTGTLLENNDITVSYNIYYYGNLSYTYQINVIPDATTSEYKLNVNPINSVLSVKQNGVDLSYSYFNKILTINETFETTSYIEVTLDVGWINPPRDIETAVYELVKLREEMRSTANMSRVEDSQNTVTTYRQDPFPKHIKNILYRYSPNSLLS